MLGLNRRESRDSNVPAWLAGESEGGTPHWSANPGTWWPLQETPRCSMSREHSAASWTKIFIFSPSVKWKFIFNGWKSLEDEKYPENINLLIALFIDMPAASKRMQERSVYLHATSRLWMNHVISYFIHPYWAHVSCKGFWLIVVLTRVASCAALWANKLRSVSQTVSLENRSIFLILKADIKQR